VRVSEIAVQPLKDPEVFLNGPFQDQELVAHILALRNP
jgi:hypothetical protein